MHLLHLLLLLLLQLPSAFMQLLALCCWPRC
jgi:hypothetical protein